MDFFKSIFAGWNSFVAIKLICNILVNLFVAHCLAEKAEEKGRSYGGWFCFCFFLGPVIGVIAVTCMKNKTSHVPERKEQKMALPEISDEKIEPVKSSSPVAEQVPSPDVQVIETKVETTVEPKAAPVSESADGNQDAPKIKKLYIIIGAVMLAVIAGLVSVIIYLLNKGPEYVYQYLPSETQYEKVEVPVYNYEQAEQVDVAMDLTLRCIENLRIRASDDFNSDVIVTMNSGTKVKVLTIGKQDEVDGEKSNWVQVEVLPGGKDKDLNRIPNGTTGWCFGGFLESCTKN